MAIRDALFDDGKNLAALTAAVDIHHLVGEDRFFKHGLAIDGVPQVPVPRDTMELILGLFNPVAEGQHGFTQADGIH